MMTAKKLKRPYRGQSLSMEGLRLTKKRRFERRDA
jgi:hypothetical protein